ncbi:HECT-domain-containing protein [Ramicandelaber brevisporus]|nr:HECT-domain-containing protein [Ramicandelaber brevisporus]
MSPLPSHVKIKVDRTSLLETAFASIMAHRPENLRHTPVVEFAGEQGIDYGGLRREFFFLLPREILRPDYGLFSSLPQGTIVINPASAMANPDHLRYFRFFGRVLGMAIFHQQFVDTAFVPCMYKMMLGRSITPADVEAIDETVSRSMQYILDNDIEEDMGLFFAAEEDVFGELVTIELKPGGKDIAVDNSNKAEYIKLLAEYTVRGKVKPQLEQLIGGMFEILPPGCLAPFDERELELLLGGIATIDVDDWEANTVYRDCTKDDELVRWFWKIVRSWSVEQQTKLLQFATGAARVPVVGFKGLMGSDGPRQFTILKTGSPADLPRASSCFNRLCLPPVPYQQTLEQKLLYAIENTTGFQTD